MKWMKFHERDEIPYKNTVGVQSWKAAHLPTLEFRVEQVGIVPVGSEGRPWPQTASMTRVVDS